MVQYNCIPTLLCSCVEICWDYVHYIRHWDQVWNRGTYTGTW
jgi:hypothetical protein